MVKKSGAVCVVVGLALALVLIAAANSQDSNVSTEQIRDMVQRTRGLEARVELLERKLKSGEHLAGAQVITGRIGRLPPAVICAVAASHPYSEVLHTGLDDGLWEVDLRQHGRHHELHITPEGKIEKVGR